MALPNLVNYQEPLVMLPENTTNNLVSCVPTGSGTFGPSSIIQVDLGSRGFLDPSSLSIRYKITIQRDPSQWGNHKIKQDSPYKQLFFHHRRKYYI